MHQKSHGNYTARFMFRLSIIFFSNIKNEFKIFKKIIRVCVCMCEREREKLILEE